MDFVAAEINGAVMFGCLQQRESISLSLRAIIFLGGLDMNRMHRKKLSVAVMNAVNAGVVVGLATPLAYAQQTPPPTAAEPQRIERIEVTGSRIPSPTLTSESPVNVISSQDIAYTGLTSTSEILNQLPQVTSGQGSRHLERCQRYCDGRPPRSRGGPHAGADRR